MIVYCDADDCKWNEDGKCNRQGTQRCTSGRIGTDGNSAMISRIKRRKTMTTVNCYLEKCIYNKDTICTKDTITLDEEHYCIGGCDEGWEFLPEEDEDD